MRSSDKLIVPNFEKTARAPPKSDLSKKIVDQYETEIKEVSLKNPIAIYIDFKPINNYTRRLYGLSDWHWIRNSWSDEQLRGFTTNSLRKLSEVLNINDGHKNSYIAVRHPEIAKICKSIDDKIIMMASPDNISNIDNSDEFIAKFEPFKEFGPKLIEIKYLKHVTDPKIRHWARRNGFKIMFNNISQGDTTQFDGIYKDNQAQLIEDLLKEGGDIVIQTNTISELKNILRKIEKNKNSAFFKKIKCHFTYQTYGCFFTTYVEFYNGNDLANLKTG